MMGISVCGKRVALIREPRKERRTKGFAACLCVRAQRSSSSSFPDIYLHVLVEILCAGHHVVGEDVDELRLVLGLEQVDEDAGGQLGKRFVGRRKDAERARAAERTDEPRGRERGDQSREVRISGGNLHNGHVRAGGGRRGRGEEAGKGAGRGGGRR